MAQAAHNSGGIVIAQVESLVDHHEILQAIHVPGILVDYVVVCDNPANHQMTFAESYNPAYVTPWQGEAAVVEAEAAPVAAGPLDARTIVQRRAVMELARRAPRVVNLGVGMPAAVGRLAHQAGLDGFTLTVEAGPIGGTLRMASASAPRPTRRRWWTSPRSSISTRAAASTWPSSAWPSWMATATSMSASSAKARAHRLPASAAYQHHAERARGGVHGHADGGRAGGPRR